MRSLSRRPVILCAPIVISAVLAIVAVPRGAKLMQTAGLATSVAPSITLLRLPDGGIQPQAVLDDGVVHVAYFKGDPASGDLYYYRFALSGGPESASSPIRINSRSGSAIAVGTIRSEQIAIGRDNRVHVIWNGVPPKEHKGEGMYVAYARLNDAGTAFEPERNLAPGVKHLDGGCTVAASEDGSVYAVWHATQPDKDGEENRGVFLALSRDDGKTFAPLRLINPTPTGVCACCSMKATVDPLGRIRIVYRQARERKYRDTLILTSTDRGATFAARNVEPWELDACPMSSFSIADGSGETAVAWETNWRVYWSKVDRDGRLLGKGIGSPGAEKSKHPIVVSNANGETLFAWTEGTAWAKGGSLSWQVYDKDSRPVGSRGHADGVPVWSLLTGYARPDGSFVVLY